MVNNGDLDYFNNINENALDKQVTVCQNELYVINFQKK